MGFRIRFRFTWPLNTVNLCEVIITVNITLSLLGLRASALRELKQKAVRSN